MAEVNEEILEQYLKVVKKWFYIGDIPFMVPSNYSNIDVLGYSPSTNKYYDFEVKYRSAYSLPDNDKNIEWLSDQFHKYKEQRNGELEKFIGNKPSVKVIVTTYKMMGLSLSKRSSMENKFHTKMAKLGYESEIWYFDTMIPELVNHVNEKGRHNTQLLQTIRMLKVYSNYT